MTDKTPSGKVHDYIASLAPNTAFTAKHVAALLDVSTTTVRNVAHRHFGFVASKGIFVTPPHHRQVKPENTQDSLSHLLSTLTDETELYVLSTSGSYAVSVWTDSHTHWQVNYVEPNENDIFNTEYFSNRAELIEEMLKVNPDSKSWKIIEAECR